MSVDQSAAVGIVNLVLTGEFYDPERPTDEDFDRISRAIVDALAATGYLSDSALTAIEAVATIAAKEPGAPGSQSGLPARTGKVSPAVREWVDSTVDRVWPK